MLVGPFKPLVQSVGGTGAQSQVHTYTHAHTRTRTRTRTHTHTHAHTHTHTHTHTHVSDAYCAASPDGLCYVTWNDDARRTTHDARRTTHDARRTTHDARRTTHDARRAQREATLRGGGGERTQMTLIRPDEVTRFLVTTCLINHVIRLHGNIEETQRSGL